MIEEKPIERSCALLHGNLERDEVGNQLTTNSAKKQGPRNSKLQLQFDIWILQIPKLTIRGHSSINIELLHKACKTHKLKATN